MNQFASSQSAFDKPFDVVYRLLHGTTISRGIDVAFAGRVAALVLGMMLAIIRLVDAATITLSPGANIQSAVNANPSGTAFILKSGVYWRQSVIPRSGDSFVGQAGADLNGSQSLTSWVQSGSYWMNSGAPAQNNPYGPSSSYCSDPSTGCVYPQDLYLNDKPLVHELNLPITPGQWYFDYTNDIIYMADNPTGQKVELSVASQAFSGYVDGVTVQNLIVEKYATPLMGGAIGPYGSNWLINSNEVRLNHAAGIKPQYGKENNEQILSNNVHDNGEEGISVGGGTGTLIEYNTIANNNYANILYWFEVGGGKISATVNAQILNNTYSNNNGTGIWSDCGATGTIISGNTVTGSLHDGIRYEISHYGTISNNTLTNNAQNAISGVCTSNAREIVLADSDNTDVTGNTITTNCAGITLTQGGRNLEVNDAVIDNRITYPGLTKLRNPIGGVDPTLPYTVFDPANQNYFDYNVYHFASSALSLTNWVYNATGLSWAGWQAGGEDIHGSAD